MSESPRTLPPVVAGLLRVQLAEIAGMTGRSPESFYAQEEPSEATRLGELLGIWDRLGLRGRDQLLDAARKLDETRSGLGGEAGAPVEDLFTASR